MASGLALVAWGTGALDRIERNSVDARFEVRGKQKAPSDVVVVGVDDATRETLNQRWPFARDEQAKLVDKLRSYDPRLIVYDVQITEASNDPDADVALFEAVQRARPVVMATTEVNPDGQTRVFGGEANVREAGAVVGSGLLPIEDATVRRFARELNGLPTLATQAYELVHNAPPRDSLFDDGEAWFDFAGGAGTVPTYSWVDVLNGKTPPEALRGKIVVVGATAPVLRDQHATSAPGNDLLPGPEIHANAIATLLAGTPLESVPGWVDALLIVLLACLIPLLAMRASLRALLAAPVALAIYLLAAQLAFGADRIVSVVYPLTGLLLGTGGTAAALLSSEIAERRRLRGIFARFVPEQVVDDVIAQTGDDLRLGGVELDATVLFCDLRGFTTYAERCSAREVIETLNVYLTEMSEAVLAHDGTVVAFLGDGMMAVFGAPIASGDHADRALAAAREMFSTRLPRVNAAIAGDDFRLGVGLNSGPVMSGNVGSERRLEYAAIGDTTNVAARLQSMTKEAGVPLLLSQSTYDRLSDHSALTEVGEMEIRGREAPEVLWTVTELKDAWGAPFQHEVKA